MVKLFNEQCEITCVGLNTGFKWLVKILRVCNPKICLFWVFCKLIISKKQKTQSLLPPLYMPEGIQIEKPA